MVSSVKQDYLLSYIFYDDHQPKWEDGDTAVYQNGMFHNPTGPAIIYANGDKYWYLHGKLHRTDGPAVVLANGYVEYWFENIQYPENDWRTLINSQ